MAWAGAGAGAKARGGVRARVRRGAKARTGAEMGVWASRTVLKILCKSSLEYLGTLVVATRAIAIRDFVSMRLMRYLDTLSSNSEGEEDSGRAMEGGTEEPSR